MSLASAVTANGGAGLTMSSDAITVDDVSFAYDNGLLALSHLSLDVPRGKSVALIGPSGCGKSTLLSLLARLRKPDAGTITWLETKVPDKTGPERLSMVFQKDTLLPWLSVRDNIELYYRFNRGDKPPDLDKTFDELLTLAHLHGFESVLPYQLSGGMRRRVAFLAAVAAMPGILLLDEPFSSLDEPTRIGIHQDVFKIIRRIGTTMILVTHDLAEAISLCDEVVILTNRPATVFKRYQVPFGGDRNMVELRRVPAFLELYGTLWEQLGLQITPRQSSDVDNDSTLGKDGT
jgi:NitT/TauT family transport system ATP-binding protein